MLEIIIALIVAIPVILFPACFIWYLNISGTWTVIKDKIKKSRTVRKIGRLFAKNR